MALWAPLSNPLDANFVACLLDSKSSGIGGHIGILLWVD
jgi:hypothetical protein